MQGFIDYLESKFVPLAAKIGGQKHLIAIRDSFASLMPLIMAGAIAVLLNNVFFVPWGLLAADVFLGADHAFIVWTNQYVAPLFSSIESGTLSILALALVFTLAFNRARQEKQDEIITGLISVGSFMLLGSLTRNNEVVASHVGNYLGAQGIFIALLTGLIAPAIYFKIVNKDMVIRMPDTVPPAVAKGFSGIIPGAVTLLFFAVVNYIFSMTADTSLFIWFEDNVGGALAQLSQGLPAILITSTLIPLLWFFGLHGANLLEAFMQPVYGTLQTENLQMFSSSGGTINSVADGLHGWVRGSWDAYVFHGGSGATLPLLVAILILSKVKDNREIARLGMGPGIFMINEPVLFGLPVVLNPIYLVPFVLNQPILAAVALFATNVGFAGPIVNSVPWTTPPVLNALLATNFSIGAGVIALVNFGIAFIIYIPFVLVANRASE